MKNAIAPVAPVAAIAPVAPVAPVAKSGKPRKAKTESEKVVKSAPVAPVVDVSKTFKALTSTNLAMFVGVDAGDVSAAHSARLAAVTTAYYHALTGQKTQLRDLLIACELRATPKACRALFPDLSTLASSKMSKVYVAYAQAICEFGIPGLDKKLDSDGRMIEASRIAGLFVAMVESLTAPAPKKAKASAPSVAEIVAPTSDAPQSDDASDTASDTDTVQVDVGTAINAVCEALTMPGFLNSDEVGLIRAALAAYDAALAAPVAEALAA
jgi:hypothetical protein